MTHPIIAIVGRPNVGKSTLLNRIATRREAVVHERPGVTRDRHYVRCEWLGREFIMVDTGGIATTDDEPLAEAVKAQANAAIDESDLVLFVVDTTVGATVEDERVAKSLQRSRTPVILVANKADSPVREFQVGELVSLGLGEPVPVSALHGIGIGELLDMIIERVADVGDVAEEAVEGRVAIVGRPNVGKSSLLNRLTESERAIVSEIPGTTRDSIDTMVTIGDMRYMLVDTAGVRHRPRDDVDYYTYLRTLRAIERSDAALLMLDASAGVTRQDQRLANLVVEKGCATVVLINKWDLLDNDDIRTNVYDQVERRLAHIEFARRLRVSARTGRNVGKIFPEVQAALTAYRHRVPTPELNRLVQEIRTTGHGVTKGAAKLRMSYATQADIEPPVFVFFVNRLDLVTEQYRRYLERTLRERFGFAGTPVKLFFKEK